MHGLTVERVFVERGVLGSKPLATAPTARRCWPSWSSATWWSTQPRRGGRSAWGSIVEWRPSGTL